MKLDSLIVLFKMGTRGCVILVNVKCKSKFDSMIDYSYVVSGLINLKSNKTRSLGPSRILVLVCTQLVHVAGSPTSVVPIDPVCRSKTSNIVTLT